MKVESLPIWLSVAVGLVALILLADAYRTDGITLPPWLGTVKERRRRMRAVRHRGGEYLVSMGLLCMAAALAGRDTWKYGTLSVIVGIPLIVFGAILNRAYLMEILLFRGPARRAEEEVKGAEEKKEAAAASEKDKLSDDWPPPSSPSSPPLPPIRIR